MFLSVSAYPNVDNNKCDGQPNGMTFPHEPERFYIFCVDGIELIRYCQIDWDFNTITGQCSEPEAVTTTPNPLPIKTCSNSPDHTTLPHPKCTMFYYCFYGQAHEDKCPFGMHWSVGASKCDAVEMARCIEGAAPEQPNVVPQPTFPTEIPPSGHQI